MAPTSIQARIPSGILPPVLNNTVSALKKAGVKKDLTYVSAAGGAFLEWMEGKQLPGVKVLEK